MMLTLMNLGILVAQKSKQDDGFYSPAKMNQNFDSSTQDDHYKGIGASNNPSAGISNVDDVVDDSTNDQNHGDHHVNGMSLGNKLILILHWYHDIFSSQNRLPNNKLQSIQE